jgi:TonB-linked SusC/RagA family outer membrane protein
MLRIMRLTSLLLLTGCLHVYAAGYSQKVTVSGTGLPIEKVFSIIKKQTGYTFIYTSALLRHAKQVTIDVKDVPLITALEKCFNDQPVTYTIVDRTIVVKTREEKVPQAQLSVLSQIKGMVLDEKNTPLQGVTVKNRKTGEITTTDTRGIFYLQAQSGHQLELSYVGYKSQTFNIAVGNTMEDATKSYTPIVIRMVIEVTEINEVVVTGYSSRKVAEITGSVQKISGDDMRSGISSANAQAMLKGKIAGVYINETGGGSVSNRGQIVMRGQASFGDQSNTNFGPLIVLDGVITTASSLQDIVNPNDIESITMLKDAASTAIYGSRAAQGVIVVTTKRGQTGKINIGLNVKYGQVKDDRLVRFMNTNELTTHITKYMQAMYNGTASIRTQFPSFTDFYNTTRPFTDADMTHYQNWDRTLFTDGHQKDINLSLSSGTEKTKFYGAIDWYKEDGTLLDDNLDRKSLRLNFDQQISNKLSVSFNTNAIIDKYLSSNSENQYYIFQPWASPTYANGQLADSIPNTLFRATAGPVKQWYDNPAYSHSYNTNIRKIQSFLGSGIIRYKITPWLTLQSTNTAQAITNNLNSYKDPRTYRGRYDGAASNRIYINGSLALTDTKTEYYLTSNQLSFNKTFGDHHISGLVGQEYSKTHMETISASAYNTTYPGERNLAAFLNYGTWINILTGSAATPSGTTAPVDKASFSLFGEGNYSFRQKYFASASVRRDASTNFGKLNRYGTFYSVSGAWLLSSEAFMRTVRPVTNLKLRAAYGTSGREAGADFLNFTVYQDNLRYDNSTTFGSAIQRLANDEITWETTYSTNLGVDLSLWKRVNLSVDWYNRLSKNLIQTVQLPSYIGFPSQVRNIGELKNTGLEIVLSTVNIKTNDFEWTTDFNISFNTNKLVKIYGDSLIDPWSASFYRYAGEDINVLKAVKFAGVNPDNGRPLFERVLPDGKIQIVDSLPLALADGTRSFRNVGSATPKFFGGITNTFRYKGISLSVLVNYVYGNTIMNQSVNNFITPTSWQSGFNLANPDKAIRFWKGPGDTDANYPDFFDLAFSTRGASNFRSSLIYQDASYLRVRNIRLGYDLPKNWIGKAHISAVNIYASADNLFLIKSKELFSADPEGARIGVATGSYTGTGFASAQPRRFLVGINVNF